VVFYLLYLSWVTVFFSLPSSNRFSDGIKLLKHLSVVQSYTVFAFAFAILIKAKTFGSNPECNGVAVVVIFRPFSAINAGRIVCWILTIIVVAIYTVITAKDYLPPPPKGVHQWIRKKSVRKPVAQPDPPENAPDLEYADGISRERGDLRSQNHINQRVSDQAHSEGSLIVAVAGTTTEL
jgi:hypothetical protein